MGGTGHYRAHSDEGIRPRRRRVSGEQRFYRDAERAADTRTYEQRWCENPARAARAEGSERRDNFEKSE